MEKQRLTQDLALSEPLRETLRSGCVLSCARLSNRAAGGARERACVAQLAEHVLGKDEVSGSIPLVGSIQHKTKYL